MYKFSYTLNDTDYLEFNIFHANNSAVYKKQLLVLRLLLPLVLAVLLLVYYTYNRDPLELLIKGIVYAIGSLLWFFVAKSLRTSSIKSNIKAMKKSGKLPFGKNTEIQFGEDDIHDISELSESKIKYSVIEKIAMGKNAIYIYFSSIQAFIIPFSVFENEEQKADFLAFINQKFAAYKK